MAVDRLRENDVVVGRLRWALCQGDLGLAEVPELVKDILRHGRWSVRATGDGALVAFASFRTFVAMPLPEGLGASFDILWRLCLDDEEARSELEGVIRRPGGGRPGDRDAAAAAALDGIGIERALREHLAPDQLVELARRLLEG